MRFLTLFHLFAAAGQDANDGGWRLLAATPWVRLDSDPLCSSGWVGEGAGGGGVFTRSPSNRRLWQSTTALVGRCGHNGCTDSLSTETMMPDRLKRNASGYAGRGPCRAPGTLRIVWRHGHAFRRKRAEPSLSELRCACHIGSAAARRRRVPSIGSTARTPPGGAADCPKCVGHSLSRERSAPTRPCA